MVNLEGSALSKPDRVGDADRCRGFRTNRVGGVTSQPHPCFGLRLTFFLSSFSSLLIRSRDRDLTSNLCHGDFEACDDREVDMMKRFFPAYRCFADLGLTL